jgi:hypothetical protein
MPAESVENVRRVLEIGRKEYDEFLAKRIRSEEQAFTDTVQLPKVTVFKKTAVKSQKKSQSTGDTAQDSKLTQLLLAVHSSRPLDESAFSHESSSHPPSLTRKGAMYHGHKSEILDCLIASQSVDSAKPLTTAAILDGAVLVHMLRPTTCATIREYFDNVFAPHILGWLKNNQRVDVVWDVYSKTSIKSGLREHRGTGSRRRVTQATKVPGNWAAFLRVDLNKQELFIELAKMLALLKLPEVTKFDNNNNNGKSHDAMPTYVFLGERALQHFASRLRHFTPRSRRS